VKLNIFLAFALVLCVAYGLLVRSQPSRPNVEVLPEMVRTVAYKAYSANPNFADGKTLQEPPPDTIPRGFRKVELQGSEADAVRAGNALSTLAPEELSNPYNFEDLAAFTRGAFVFRTWCLPCHGEAGRGDGAVAMRGFPAPPPFNSEKSLALKDGRMFYILTFGQKNMPSYASQVTEDDRWKAILYVRSLQRSAQATEAASLVPATPIPPAGQEVRK
jgi:mono/diheme cytochrome c family protein